MSAKTGLNLGKWDSDDGAANGVTFGCGGEAGDDAGKSYGGEAQGDRLTKRERKDAKAKKETDEAEQKRKIEKRMKRERLSKLWRRKYKNRKDARKNNKKVSVSAPSESKAGTQANPPKRSPGARADNKGKAEGKSKVTRRQRKAQRRRRWHKRRGGVVYNSMLHQYRAQVDQFMNDAARKVRQMKWKHSTPIEITSKSSASMTVGVEALNSVVAPSSTISPSTASPPAVIISVTGVTEGALNDDGIEMPAESIASEKSCIVSTRFHSIHPLAVSAVIHKLRGEPVRSMGDAVPEKTTGSPCAARSVRLHWQGGSDRMGRLRGDKKWGYYRKLLGRGLRFLVDGDGIDDGELVKDISPEDGDLLVINVYRGQIGGGDDESESGGEYQFGDTVSPTRDPPATSVPSLFPEDAQDRERDARRESREHSSADPGTAPTTPQMNYEPGQSQKRQHPSPLFTPPVTNRARTEEGIGSLGMEALSVSPRQRDRPLTAGAPAERRFRELEGLVLDTRESVLEEIMNDGFNFGRDVGGAEGDEDTALAATLQREYDDEAAAIRQEEEKQNKAVAWDLHKKLNGGKNEPAPKRRIREVKNSLSEFEDSEEDSSMGSSNALQSPGDGRRRSLAPVPEGDGSGEDDRKPSADICGDERKPSANNLVVLLETTDEANSDGIGAATTSEASGTVIGDGTSIGAATASEASDVAIGDGAATTNATSTPTGFCSDRECGDFCFSPVGLFGALCTGCEKIFCEEHLDTGGTCPSCAAPEEPEAAPAVMPAAARGESLLSQLESSPGAVLRKSRDGKANDFRVKTQIGASRPYFGSKLGSAAEGAILYSCFQFCRGFHTKSYETNFPELLDCLVESLDLSERYSLANPSSVLAKKHFTGDMREVFEKLWRQFQDNCLPHLPSAEDDERVAAVSDFLHQLSSMSHEQIRAQAEHISLPWRDQDGQLLCDLISDSMSFQPGQSPWDDYINVLKEIPAIRRYFCANNKSGHPGVHRLVSPNTGMTDRLAAQTIRQRKQRELDHQAYILYMALAEDEVHRGRFRQCVGDEVLAPFLDTGDNDFHPPLRPDTVKDIIGRMKRAVAHYLAEEGIVERPYELFCLEEGPALDGQYDVSDSVNSHFEQKAIAVIDTPENRERCKQLMSALLERREASAVEKAQYCAQLDHLGPVWKHIDQYQTQCNGKPRVMGEDGQPVMGDDGSEKRLELSDFISQIEAKIKESGLLTGLTIPWQLLIDDDKWGNVRHTEQRRNALGIFARWIANCLLECAGGCGRSPTDIAKDKGALAMVVELKRCLCRPTCKLCHDSGENSRHFDLHLSKEIDLLPPALTAPSERKTVREVLVDDPRTRLKFTILFFEVQARRIQRGRASFSTFRSLVTALFPEAVLLDNLCLFDAHWWNKKDESSISYFRETGYNFERLVGLCCGVCANDNCKPENRNFKRRSPRDQYGDVWDHHGKKCLEISKLVNENPIYLMNELCSWVVKLCPFCNATRNATQRNCCANRCYDIIASMAGSCGCEKTRNAKQAKPCKVALPGYNRG